MIFHMSEKDVKFASTYEMVNPKTNKSMVFEFTHSTGPEFDPKTVYVYKNKEAMVSIFVHNDPKITGQRAKAYLAAKLKQ